MARLRFGRPISLRWNGLLLEGPANTVFEIPDEFYEEFNQDIGTVEPTIVWLDADEAATLRGRVTALEGAGAGAPLSTATPLALGTAAVGTEVASSHGDHVHPTTGLALSGHNHTGTYATTTHAHAESDVTSLVADLADKVSKTIVDAKGDLIVGTAADTVSRLAVSATNGHVLSADSTAATGLAWVAQSGGSGGGASLSDANALALGTAAPGVAATASRYDHVHPTTGVSLTGHNHDAAYSPLGSEGRADIVYELCQNSSGGTIPAYSVVYVDGANGTNPTIALADADTEATSSKTLGFTETSSANGDTVTVITQGRLAGVDTSAASAAGVSVWLSGTAGGYVFGSPPSEPAHSVYLGVVTKKNPSTGEIFVKVQNGYELDELHNVSAASPTDGDLIQYVSSTGLWTKKSISAAGISGTAHAHSGVYDPAGTTSTHSALTSTVHGITDTANLVYTSDSRLSNARTPSSTLAHASTHLSGGTDALSGISPSQVTGTAVVTADSRLSDSRTPTAHKTSHATGGADALVASDIGAAPLASPTFTGTVTTPNATISTLITAGYVKNSVAGVLSSSSAIPQADVTSLTTDLGLKAPLAGPTFTGTVTLPSTTSIGTVSSTEIGYVDGVTSAIQTQIDAKAPLASPTFTGDVTINAQGDIRFADADSSNYVGFQAPATITANKLWTLPAADGTANQAIVTNGSGTLSFATSSGGGMTLLASGLNITTDLSVTSIPATYKDIYIRVHGLATTSSINISAMALNSNNFSNIYQGMTRIDNDSSYASNTIEGVVSSSTTTSATKNFPGSSLVEVDSATYGYTSEIMLYDYANASGLNSGVRHFKYMTLAPNGSASPSNASMIFGQGRYTLSSTTDRIVSFIVANNGGVAMTVYVYGVS